MADALIHRRQVRPARAGVGDAGNVVAGDAAEAALADKLPAGGNLGGRDRHLVHGAVGVGAFQRRQRLGQPADIGFAELRHAQAHPGSGPACLRQYVLEPGRAQFVADAGQGRRYDGFAVVGALDLPQGIN